MPTCSTVKLWNRYLAQISLPDLEIFAMLEGDCVQPFELLQKIFLELDQDVCSVKPGVFMNN